MKSKISLITLILILYACKKEGELPKVITSNVSELTWEYVIVEGEVLDNGSSPVTARGFIYSIRDTLPTFDREVYSRHTTDSSGTGIGKFTSKITLILGGDGPFYKTTNYIRAYATSSAGTAYGKVISVFPNPNPPKFVSIQLFDLKSTSASFDCDLGLSGYSEFYFCYSQNPNPTIDGTHSIAQPENSQYKLTGLSPNTKYYVRGYIKNISGFSYSPEISFTTFDGELTDVNGYVYPYKVIGTQTWMARNLIVTKYNDGTAIPTLWNDWDWSVTKSGAHDGGCYNYYAVVDERKLCPSGWHMPSDSEWKTLEMYLGMSPVDADLFSDERGTNEGGKLKMTGSYGYGMAWEYPNLGATNSSGFSAYGSGWRYASGGYSTSGYATRLWTSTEFNETGAIERELLYNSAKISRFPIDKNYGLSVRCIKN